MFYSRGTGMAERTLGLSETLEQREGRSKGRWKENVSVLCTSCELSIFHTSTTVYPHKNPVRMVLVFHLLVRKWSFEMLKVLSNITLLKNKTGLELGIFWSIAWISHCFSFTNHTDNGCESHRPSVTEGWAKMMMAMPGPGTLGSMRMPEAPGARAASFPGQTLASCGSGHPTPLADGCRFLRQLHSL